MNRKKRDAEWVQAAALAFGWGLAWPQKQTELARASGNRNRAWHIGVITGSGSMNWRILAEGRTEAAAWHAARAALRKRMNKKIAEADRLRAFLARVGT